MWIRDFSSITFTAAHALVGEFQSRQLKRFVISRVVRWNLNRGQNISLSRIFGPLLSPGLQLASEADYDVRACGLQFLSTSAKNAELESVNFKNV
ncbi:hypothetical protein T265_06689 [Opisthorchis viverrini]|uniref:Uncharacterized protein n=1 Tax=Opisthorchis viverrini TaxID=6198 RepID=A0A074ZFE3_OPIVI|nr:hypothetical protein T265_06689 [Opisthorchis viverrini]KER26001.1 hypothetical protein T265_06689 [Opisthorchis viverrini]